MTKTYETKSLEDLAENLGIEDFTNSSDTIAPLAKQMLQELHTNGADPVKDSQVEDAYYKIFKYEMLVEDSSIPYYLKGPGGHGKSTVVKLAAQKVAEAMGYNFIDHPPQSYQPQPNDYVFYNLALGGLTSNLKQSLPYTEETVDGANKELKSAVNSIIVSLQHVAGSVVNLDDFENSANTVQNSMMDFMLNRQFDHVDLSKSGCYLTGSANLGAALDGAKTFEASIPQLGRVNVLYVADKLGNFLERTRKKYNDLVGDGYIAGFLEANPEMFFYLPGAKNKRHLSPSPRNWDRAILVARQALHEFYQTGHYPFDEVKRDVSGACGYHAADRFNGHVHDLINGAAIIARKIVDNEQLTNQEADQLKTCLDRSGSKVNIGAKAEFFTSMFPRSTADFTLLRIKEDLRTYGPNNQTFTRALTKRLETLASAFYDKGLVNGQTSKIAEGWAHFCTKATTLLANTDYINSGKDKKLSIGLNFYELMLNACANLKSGNFNTVVENGEMREDVKETTFKNVISNYVEEEQEYDLARTLSI